MTQPKVLESIKRTLSANMPKDGQAFLYGSRARGDFRDDSDWDVLVLLNQEYVTAAEKNRIEDSLFGLGFETDQLISPVIYSVKDWEWRRHTPFYDNVMHDRRRLV